MNQATRLLLATTLALGLAFTGCNALEDLDDIGESSSDSTIGGGGSVARECDDACHNINTCTIMEFDTEIDVRECIDGCIEDVGPTGPERTQLRCAANEDNCDNLFFVCFEGDVPIGDEVVSSGGEPVFN